MKKMLILIVIVAFAAPALAANEVPGLEKYDEILGPYVMYPGDMFSSDTSIHGPWPTYYDIWIFLCIGTGTVEVAITDCCIMGDTMIALLLQYGIGFLDWALGTSPASAIVSAPVSTWGIYFIVTGFYACPGGFGAGYYIDAYFG